MKIDFKKVICFCAMFCWCFGAEGTVRTVNNAFVPVFAGQFASIRSAIQASNSGDTILVAGSLLPYEKDTLLIDRPIVLLGAGYNPSGISQPTTVVWPVYIIPAASGSVIMGFYFDKQIHIAGTTPAHSNITLARNLFNSFVRCNYNHMVNVKFINNIFTVNSTLELATTSYSSDIKLYNNIFILSTSNYSINANKPQQQTLVIDHNLFLKGTNGSPSWSYATTIGAIRWSGASFATDNKMAHVTNNIFYGVATCQTAGSGYTNNMLMNNNVVYYPGGAGSAPNLPLSGSLGLNNQNNVNPLITTLFSSTTNIYLDLELDNLALQASSPCRGAATDGSDIGPTGGAFPIYAPHRRILTGEPNAPTVYYLNISDPSTYPLGLRFPITVRAKNVK